MGRILAKKVKGMNWKAKLSLILIFTLMFSTFMHQGWYQPKPVQAAITQVTAFTNVWHSATLPAAANVPTFAVTGTSGTRMLVVALSYEASSSAALTVTSVTYGGVAMTQASAGDGTTSASMHSLIFYLKENAIMNGTAQRLAVNITGGGTSVMSNVWYAVYTGVDQAATPDARNYNSGATAGTSAAFATGLTVNTDDQAVMVATAARAGGAVTWNAATNWTKANNQPSGTTGLGFVATRTIPVTNTTDTASVTGITSSRRSMTGISMKAAIAGTAPAEVGGTLSVTPQYGSFAGSPMTITENFTSTAAPTGCRYTLNNWSSNAAGTVSGTGPYTCTASGVTATNGTALTIAMDMTNAIGTSTHTATLSRTADAAAPTTTATGSGGYTFGSWTATTPISVTLSASDGTGSGVVDTKYCVDTADSCTPTTVGTSVDITCATGYNCNQYVRYRSTDNLTQVETTKSSQVLQDLLAPDLPSNTCPGTYCTTYAPADEATNIPVATTLQAATATDTGSNGIQYYFNIVDTGTYAVNSGWQAGTSYAPAGLQYGTTYFWKVKARDAAGNESAWSTPRSFNTAPQCFRNDPSLDFLATTINTVTTDGGTANYTLRIRNNDIGGCPNTIFTLTTTETSDDSDNFVDIAKLNGANPPLTTNSLGIGGYQDIVVGVTARVGKTFGRAKNIVTAQADAFHGAITSTNTTTNLNVSTCNAAAPQFVIGPDAGNIAVGGTLNYSISVKNKDTGAACLPVTYTVSVVSDSAGAPNFNPSNLTYLLQSGSFVTITVNPSQTGTVNLAVSATAGAAIDAVNVTTVGVSAAGHTAPANVTATTTVGNKMLHNSINIQSTRWSSFGGWGVPNGMYGEFICNTCHTLDGTTSNIKKVLGLITTPDDQKGIIPGDGLPIVYDRPTGTAVQGVLGFDSGGATPRAGSSKICEICHTYDAGKINGVNAHPYATAATLDNHQNADGADCILCHRHNAGFKAPACTTCHATPPINVGGLATAPFTTGSATAGAHDKHANILGYTCDNCHNNNVMPQASTVKPGFGNISIGFKNLWSTTGSYSGQSNVSYSINNGAHFLGSGSKNCSNVYCHSIGNLSDASGLGTIVAAGGLSWRTIAWDGTPITCDKCHGDLAGKAHPAYTTGAAGSTTANSHVKHVEGSALSCDYCHITTTTDATIPPTTVIGGGAHLNRVENVAFKSNGGKTGTWNTAGKTCSTTYCHGDPASVAWGGGTTCASCHGASNNGDLSGGAATGHAKHYQSAATPNLITDGNAHTTSAYVFACLNCHPTGNHAKGPADSTGPVLQDAEINGTKLATVNYTQGSSSTTDAKSFNYTNGRCSTVCHTKDGVTPGSGIMATPAWNTINALGCGYCHNKPGDASPTWTAAHSKHLNVYSANTNMTCEACHTGTAASNSALQATSTARDQHPNANRDVAIGTFAGGTWVTIAGAQGSQTCANTYCHSSGTSTTGSHTAASWSGNTTCSSCHRDNTNWTTTTSTGAHWTHAVKTNYSCNLCHNATASSFTTISGFARHVNKTVTINFNGAWSTTTSQYNGNSVAGASIYEKTVNTTTGTCNTTFCHGSVSRNWGTVSNDAQCVKCHGVAGTTTAQYGTTPNTAAPGWNTIGVNTNGTVGTITNNVSSDQKVGAHDSHLRNLKGYSGGVACTACHNVTAIGDAGHMDGASTFAWSSLAKNQSLATSWSTVPLTPVYSGGNCSSNYCHGYSAWASVRGTTWTSLVSWTNNAWLTVASAKNATSCNRCHASPPTASTRYDHSLMSIATNCAPCHNHEGSGATHIDGTLYGAGTCNTCHSYDVTDAGAWTTVIQPNSNLWNSTNAWGAHVKHISHLKTRNGVGALVASSDTYGGANFNKVCGFCHSNNATSHNQPGQYTRSIIWNTTSHQFGSAPLDWNTVGRTCSNLDCHYKASPIW